jgi:phosphoribosylglycinamide formyltransferase-1
MVNIGVLISGNGTNLQAIIDGIKEGRINGSIKLVISNRKDAYGLVRCQKENIESMYINPKEYDDLAYNRRLMEEFKKRDIDLIVLAGYMRVLSKEFVENYENRIINIHPSLIPSFSGKGYYGERVHRAALDYGVKYTGATVHFVDEGTDTGPIILQEVVPVYDEDTVETLSQRVLEVEHRILVEAVSLYCQNKLIIDGRKVKIVKE